MPRPKRIMSESGYYHVMYRGNNKEFIFADNKMKELFLKLLTEVAASEEVEIVCYCIMDNHIHLIVKSDFEVLSRFSKRLNLIYAKRYNYSHNRSGHTFEDRFRSEPIADDSYLLQAIRYIHNNPVNAEISTDATLYKWSSYNDYVRGKSEVIIEKQMSFVIEAFGDLERFKDFHKQYDDDPFLDTKEDSYKVLEKKVQRLVSEYFKTNGLIDGKQLYSREDMMEELIRKLLEETSASHQKISEILGISKRIVQYAAKKEN